MCELESCVDHESKILVTDESTSFECDGNTIHLYSVSKEDLPLFISRFKEQKEIIDNLTPEQKANREAQLRKSIAGTAKKLLDKNE
jgi:hypothetical protein